MAGGDGDRHSCRIERAVGIKVICKDVNRDGRATDGCKVVLGRGGNVKRNKDGRLVRRRPVVVIDGVAKRVALETQTWCIDDGAIRIDDDVSIAGRHGDGDGCWVECAVGIAVVLENVNRDRRAADSRGILDRSRRKVDRDRNGRLVRDQSLVVAHRILKRRVAEHVVRTVVG